jgi:predicted double-glycine peptidase
MLKIKPFRQQTGHCGPASLKMVLDYYGLDKSEQELIELTDCNMDLGVEAGRLLTTAQDLGFNGYIKDNAELPDIKQEVIEHKRPVIVDWFSEDDGHYSVVVDINDENIYLLDPELGYVRAMRLNKFYRVWFDFPGEYIKTKDDLTIRRMIVIFPS